MRSRQLSALALLMLLAVACGSESAASTASAVSATALRREQAIATFTAEAQLAPTATRFPVVTPTSAISEEQVAASPTPDAVPVSSPTVPAISDQRALELQAIEALLIVRGNAMSSGDFEAWYNTCAPSIRDNAIETDALGKQLRAIRFEPDELVTLKFVLEEAIFSAETSATVLWGIQSGQDYFSGLGGPYVKVNDQWFSMGWGCAG